MREPYNIIDITQPIARKTACYPGDTPFDYSLKSSFSDNGTYNVTAFEMSPHIGTHVDAPAHVLENMEASNLAGNMPLAPFIGPCYVLDLSPCNTEIRVKDVEEKLSKMAIPSRILLRTCKESHYDVFNEQSAYLSLEIIEFFHQHGVQLIGMDTPSVDAIDAKELKAHHALISHQIVWLENLDLSAAKEGHYFLSALPVKFMELEAAPVRAVLIGL